MAMEMSRSAIPYTPNQRPLHNMVIAIVTTAGVHLKEQMPFSSNKFVADFSYREIPGDVRISDLTVTHAADAVEYDVEAAKQDINTIFPIERLRELAAEGFLGGTADAHYSMMGYVLRFNRLMEETVPTLSKKIVRSKTDGVVLTAGCHYSHRTVVVLQRAIEMAGIPTVLITLDPEKSGMYRPPRAIHPKGFPYGLSLGKPFDPPMQKLILMKALEQLTNKQEPGIIHEIEIGT